MTRLKAVLGLSLMMLLGATSTPARMNDQAAVAIHSDDGVCKCTDWCSFLSPIRQRIPCSKFGVHQGAFEPRLAFLLVAHAEFAAGVSGLSCGVNATNVDVQWTLCADQEMPLGPWPAAGGGNVISWDIESNCQRTIISPDGVHAAAGFFYLYAYGNGSLEVTPNTANGESDIFVRDCTDAESPVLTPGGILGFEDTPGLNPCLSDVPIEASSWGKLKRNYGKP